jgi:hypothetical protein
MTCSAMLRDGIARFDVGDDCAKPGHEEIRASHEFASRCSVVYKCLKMPKLSKFVQCSAGVAGR